MVRRASPASSSRSAIDRAARRAPGEGFRSSSKSSWRPARAAASRRGRLDIRRPRGDDIGRQPWRILAEDRLASIEGLHRLSLQPDKQFAAKNLVSASR
jgi:hypothetical protein